ncbi:serine/threonine-protein phosphatase, partial [Streptomyces sp. TRM76130]|nr:serine/threonine-protein phosphatase [Streptomyces sp. TRM76130]
REAVHDGDDLGDVLRRLDRALVRHLEGRARDGTAGEEFVTVLLLEIGPDGEMRTLNCGHPWPCRITGTGIEPLARTDPLPPLGLFPLPDDLPTERHGRLLPGQALLLHTDGAEDARDGRGRFFPLRETLADAVREQPLCPRVVLHRVLTALLRHTHGSPTDDVALLMLHHD